MLNFMTRPATQIGARRQLRSKMRRLPNDINRLAHLAAVMGDAKLAARTRATAVDEDEASTVRLAARTALFDYADQLLVERGEQLSALLADAERMEQAIDCELASFLEMGTVPSEALLEIDARTLARTRRSHERIAPLVERMARMADVLDEVTELVCSVAFLRFAHGSLRPSTSLKEAYIQLSREHARQSWSRSCEAKVPGSLGQLARTAERLQSVLSRLDGRLDKLAACRADGAQHLPAHVQVMADAAERLSAEHAARTELREEFDAFVAQRGTRQLG